MVRRVSHPHFTPFSSFTSGHSRHHVHVHLVTSAPRSARRGSVLRSAGTCRSATSWSCPWPSRRRDAEQVPCVRRACGGMGHRGGWSEGGARRRSSRWEGHGGTTGCFTNLHLDAQGVVHGHPLAFNWLLVDTLSVVLANDGFISASASNGTRVYRSRLEGPHGRHALDSPGRFVDDAWTVDRGTGSMFRSRLRLSGRRTASTLLRGCLDRAERDARRGAATRANGGAEADEAW